MSSHTVKRRRLSESPGGVSRTGTSAVSEQDSSANRPVKAAASSGLKHGGSSKPARQTRSGAVKEMALANGLYKFSFFKLQLDELITESRPSYDKQLSTIKDTLHEVKDLIESLPERSAKPALEAEKEMRQLHGVTVPYPEPRPGKDTKYAVMFARPANINVVGSFALRTGLKTAAPYVVDMSVTMPSSIFQEKDYTNFRYFHKRAYYVACIAAGIKDKKSTALDINYEFQDGDALRPTILLQPAATKSGHGRSKFQIRIITAVEDTLFPISRTLPMKNNIRRGEDGESKSPVIYDGKRGLNVLYKMTQWSYFFLRREAGTTLRMLNESRDDNFEKVFILNIDEPLLRFDRLVTLPAIGNDGLALFHKEREIYEVLLRALGDRVDLIYISTSPTSAWSVETKGQRKSMARSFYVGLLLNSENATRVVDHGPSAEEKDAAASFRAFWGEKAELRRFKDGSIRESLVWSENSSIVHQILLHILKRHFSYGEGSIGYVGDEFDEQLQKNGDGVVSYSNSAFQIISDAFNSLEKSIQTMEGVPLTVRHLAPASSLLRYTALRVDRNHGAVPVNVVLQFESSARWPDDLVAIQMTKVAFLAKIGDALTDFGDFSSARVGLENEQSKILNNAFLDVTHASGIVFRLRIHHDREQTLLERQVKEQGKSPQGKQEIAYALSAYKRLFIHSPRLSQAVRTLCTRLPLLSPTIRLLKYWFSSHLFDAHINEELIELMSVRTFTQPHPWETPSSVMAGFLRTLHFISRWDWQQEPLIVDLGGELDQATIELIRTRFVAWRNIDPAMNSVSMFTASDVDPEGVTWTQYEMPPKVVAARICTLAKAVMKLVREQGHRLDISQLFLPALEPYDFVIHLHPKLLNERSSSLIKFKNLSAPGDSAQLQKQAAVRAFVCDLQACFSPNILFFWGAEQPNIVAGLWNPQTLKKNWSLGLTYSTMPEGMSSPASDCSVSINRTAMLNEISRLGSDMVSRIEVHNK
ncbi:Nrap protein [Aspergillus tetrazonus]